MSDTNNPKLFGAFVTGVYKKVFEHEPEINLETLKEQIFPDVSVEALTELFDRVSDVLKKAGFDDWELEKLETELKSTSFSAAQQDVIMRFWRVHKPKLHDILSREVNWNNSLSKLSWRIDAKTKSRSVSELNDLTAILELNIQPSTASNASKDPKVVRFEMDQNQLNKVLAQINELQKQLTKFT